MRSAHSAPTLRAPYLVVSLLGPRETDIVVVQAQECAVPWSPRPRDLICGRYKREECVNYVEIGGEFIVARASLIGVQERTYSVLRGRHGWAVVPRMRQQRTAATGDMDTGVREERSAVSAR